MIIMTTWGGKRPRAGRPKGSNSSHIKVADSTMPIRVQRDQAHLLKLIDQTLCFDWSNERVIRLVADLIRRYRVDAFPELLGNSEQSFCASQTKTPD
jgi:hypothetical protein